MSLVTNTVAQFITLFKVNEVSKIYLQGLFISTNSLEISKTHCPPQKKTFRICSPDIVEAVHPLIHELSFHFLKKLKKSQSHLEIDKKAGRRDVIESIS